MWQVVPLSKQFSISIISSDTTSGNSSSIHEGNSAVIGINFIETSAAMTGTTEALTRSIHFTNSLTKKLYRQKKKMARKTVFTGTLPA